MVGSVPQSGRHPPLAPRSASGSIQPGSRVPSGTTVPRYRGRQAHFFFQVRVRRARVVNACSFRCSSTCCKHPPQKIDLQSLAADFRSNSASRLSSARPGPLPQESFDSVVPQLPAPAVQHVRVHSQARATSANETPSFQSPYGLFLKTPFVKLPSRQSHDSILHQ